MCMHKKELNKISFKLYYKDHLGNIRAVMDGASGTITQAQGFDAWGDICRTYSTTDTTVNKFTGKERDQETGYDYFGARYYDSRIGRWLQTEPLYNKYLQFSPYQYGLLNPMILRDIDAKWIPEYNSKDNSITVKAEEGDTDEDLATQLGISMEKFIKLYQGGLTSYDIILTVTPNTNYEGTVEKSNCHGFVYNAILGGTEILSGLDPEGELYKNFLSEYSNTPNSGDLAIFYLSAPWRAEPKNKDSEKGINIPQHFAIFIIKDRKGNPYFLNRLDNRTIVTCNDLSQINKYNKERAQRVKDITGSEPQIMDNPIYYKKKIIRRK